MVTDMLTDMQHTDRAQNTALGWVIILIYWDMKEIDIPK